MSQPNQPSEMRPRRFTLNKLNTHRTVQHIPSEKQLIPLIQFVNDQPVIRPELQRSLAIRANTPFMRCASPVVQSTVAQETADNDEISQDGTNATDIDIRIIETVEIVYDEVETVKHLIKHLSKELAVIRDDIESIKDTNEKILQTLMLTS